MFTAIKLFYQNDSPMVALYGAATEDGDGWQCNLPAHEVLAGDPARLPPERLLSLAEAQPLIGFTPAFQARLAPVKPIVNMSGLVREISLSTDLPEADVRRVVVSLLRELRTVVKAGGHFNSANLRLRPHPKTAGMAVLSPVPPKPTAARAG
jgi:hypothetical protein